MSLLVHFNEVKKTLGTFSLQDISFALPKGYILGVIGENGAGKTSLLHLLLGLYRKDSGEISVLGMDYDSKEKEIKNEIGFVLVDELFNQEFTLAQNGDVFGKYYERYDKKVFLYYCKEFDLDCKKKLKRLSKGEKLKFQFAFALAHDPKLLVLDEPTANFDPKFQKKFREILTKFVRDGEHSVILATHLTTDLDQIADYILFMEKGRMLFYMDKESLYDKYRMVTGEDYKINLLKGEQIVYKEKGQYSSRALIRHHKWNNYDALQVRVPTIEEMMYYIVKGGYHV